MNVFRGPSEYRSRSRVMTLDETKFRGEEDLIAFSRALKPTLRISLVVVEELGMKTCHFPMRSSLSP